MADFTSGADFITFSPSPPASPGPSRPRTASPSAPRASPDSDDARLLALRAGRRGEPDDVPVKPGKKRKSKKDKEKGRAKEAEQEQNGRGAANGRGRQGDGADQAGKKRKRDDAEAAAPAGRAGRGEIPRSLKDERRAAERAVPWADDVDWAACGNPAEMLNAEIHAFFRYMSPTRAEYAVRRHTIDLISLAINALWPEAEVTPFGSWQTQLYLPTGDIDLVVLTPRLTDANKNKLLHALAREMRVARITDTVAVISKAKVPIIKFVTLEGRLNVDISMGQANGVSAGKIVNHYLDALAGARELILVVKAFLSQRSMNEVFTGGLGSYSVICMVISFMQVHPKLRRAEMDAAANLGTLLIEFFELYGRNFNYDTVGICIRRGGSYYSKLRRGWHEHARQPFLLSIEDPQDPDNDISRSSFGIRQVKLTLAGAYDLLQARVFERAAQLAGGRDAADVDPDEASILSGVMGVTKETIKHRRELRALYDSGRLQRRLGLPDTGADPDAHLPIERGAHAGAPASSPPPSRGQLGLRGIVVDDDEVDGAASDSESGSASEAASDSGSASASGSVDDSDGSEPGEVRQVRPRQAARGAAVAAGTGTRKDRFASVSQDSDDGSDDGDVEFVPDGESRYALGRARAPAPARAQARASVGGSGSSDSDVELLGAKPAPRARPGRPGARDRRQARADKRAFWAAKGGAGAGGDDDDYDAADARL